MPSATTIAMAASCSVTGSFSRTSDRTDVLSRIDSPRFPESTPWIQ